MRKTILTILLLSLFLIFPAFAQNLNLIPVNVTKVVDGDTIEVELNQKIEKVRFIGVDCPESTTRLDPYGKEASNFTKEWLSGKEIYLEFDTQVRDRYGRILAYVWLTPIQEINEEEIRSKMFNAILLSEGYAQIMTIPPNLKYVKYFINLQKEAQENKKGLWGITIAKEEQKEEISTQKLSLDSIKSIRKDLDDRRELIRKIYTFASYGPNYNLATYVEPEGIVIILIGGYGSTLTLENLNLFFEKLCEAFATAKYPPEVMINVYVSIFEETSLMVKVPIGAIYDYFKEKITRPEFLSKCTTYINGERVFLEEEGSPLYVGNQKSKIFHYLCCRYSSQINDENKVYFTSRDDAINLGYRPCEVCKP
ncbi:MAG TPA: thermonuclease family protein [Dictyoglomaceae bacterium]|nr:thermonuclease family protein [Dictyoglomaceae bacterium]HOL39778.1 thermonuclease family protein [Dictyoglomaceae bacterium]HPP16242.1 thermonuclease family protein [Dictyoglomaceae bacterium]